MTRPRLTTKQYREAEEAFSNILSQHTDRFDALAKTYAKEEQASIERKARTNKLVDGLFRGEDNDSPEEA